MKIELRNRVGEVLQNKKNDKIKLESIENNKVFCLLKYKNHLSNIQFKDTRPLLRQAIVAGCAAFETYTADKITEKIAPILRRNTLPKKMEEIQQQ